jgi:hypothetical protein
MDAMFIQRIPVEIWGMIADYVPCICAARMKMVCKHLSKSISHRQTKVYQGCGCAKHITSSIQKGHFLCLQYTWNHFCKPKQRRRSIWNCQTSGLPTTTWKRRTLSVNRRDLLVDTLINSILYQQETIFDWICDQEKDHLNHYILESALMVAAAHGYLHFIIKIITFPGARFTANAIQDAFNVTEQNQYEKCSQYLKGVL